MEALANNPCTSREGKPKRRWATLDAALYVIDLWARGLNPHHPEDRAKACKYYAYRCPGCRGWHLSRCKNSRQRNLHKNALFMVECMKLKKSQNAGDKLREAEGGLTGT